MSSHGTVVLLVPRNGWKRERGRPGGCRLETQIPLSHTFLDAPFFEIRDVCVCVCVFYFYPLSGDSWKSVDETRVYIAFFMIMAVAVIIRSRNIVVIIIISNLYRRVR